MLVLAGCYSSCASFHRLPLFFPQSLSLSISSYTLVPFPSVHLSSLYSGSNSNACYPRLPRPASSGHFTRPSRSFLPSFPPHLLPALFAFFCLFSLSWLSVGGGWRSSSTRTAMTKNFPILHLSPSTPTRISLLSCLPSLSHWRIPC